MMFDNIWIAKQCVKRIEKCEEWIKRDTETLKMMMKKMNATELQVFMYQTGYDEKPKRRKK